MVNFLHFLIHYLIKKHHVRELAHWVRRFNCSLCCENSQHERRSSRRAVKMWILSPSDLRGASWCWNRTENCRHKVRKDDDASAETPAVWRPTEATQQLVVQRVYSERCQKEHVYCFPLICWRCRYVQMHVVLIHVTLAPDDHFKVPHKQREVTSFHRHPAILITSQEVKKRKHKQTDCVAHQNIRSVWGWRLYAEQISIQLLWLLLPCKILPHSESIFVPLLTGTIRCNSCAVRKM